MLTKSKLKGIFAEYGFRPVKRLGENYLIDANIKDKIIASLGAGKGDAVVEIGPGLGALTFDIAAAGADVYAVEKDRKAFAILKEVSAGRFPNLRLFCGDFLEFDLGALNGRKRLKVVGNLPYYITTPIIEHLLANKRYISFILVTVQREVANRLLSAPGTKDYGSISCFVQYHARPEYLFTIRRTAFYPEPEVDSSLIRLDMLKEPSVKAGDEKLLFKVIRGSFNQRRKSIINSLSRKEVLDMPKERLAAILRTCGIDPAARPEDLSLSAFARISDALSQ
jgi:16S rRNA (adenine1518-N6/adenine1519-N6)-dimethyltransferase